jgi:hypothetical protein
MSPIERSRINRMRDPVERLGRTVLGFKRAFEMEGPFAQLFGLNLRFVNEHNRNVVFDRIDAMALAAFESLSIGRELHGRFAQGTNKNIQ